MDLGWMTPQTCLLWLSWCCCDWTEHKRTEKGSLEDSGTQRDPHQKTGDRCRTGICVSCWAKQMFLAIFMSTARRIWSHQGPTPPRKGTRGWAMSLAPNLWVWGKLVSSFSLLLPERQCLFVSPHHIHPGAWVERRCFGEGTLKMRDLPSHKK